MLVFLALLMLAAPTGQIQPPPLAQILERATEFVRRFEDDFAVVVSDEQYRQTDVIVTADGRPRSRSARNIRSETLFAWLPEQQSWLTARHVLTVDGVPVRDSKERLDAALAENQPDSRARLRRLRDEGARFNIGRVFRNFNDPTLVLQFLNPVFQPRFVFSMLGGEKVDGVDAWKVAFAERAQPTIIQTPTSDLLSNGFLWIGRVDGAVVRTSLTLKDAASNTRADIVVEYRADAKLGIRVPVRMVERYAQQALGNIGPSSAPVRVVPLTERIECVATYSNFRRFETSGRLVTPN